MIDKMLLDLVACPETHQPLRLAEAAVVERLNARIKAGDLVNRGGQKVTEPIDGGLIPEGGKVLYPIRSDIPILLVEDALPLS
jgi:uncharacterized protein YbaR (Trm112 family)